MTKTLDIAWLAGILEGEGSFQFTKSNSPVITLKMVDEDIINRVSHLCKKHYHEDRTPTRNGNQVIYRIQINGSIAIGWMLTIYSFMGKRRRAKIREVVEQWKNCDSKYISLDTFRCGHPKIPANTIYSGIYKVCNTCHKAHSKRYRDEKAKFKKAILS